ncbi:MAG: hypothetical protein ACO2Z5_06430 [Burkholderiaceae bacterium]|jgi:hypothetical protein
MLSDLLAHFRSSTRSSEGGPPKDMEQATHWAEAIGLELKGLISQTVLAELEQREKKYLQSILAKSQFVIDSLVVIPLDKDASENFESFLQVHEEIDPGFKLRFFRSLMESQYRSARGSLVVVSPDFQPTVQFLSQSLEQPSQDERYQVSLRGRRLNFQVQVSLRGPVAQSAPSGASTAAAAAAVASVFGRPGEGSTGAAADADNSLLLRIWDAQGERMLEVTTPFLIGRESPSQAELGGLSFVTLHGQYVSRRHLVVLNVLDETYFFIHDAASLSCLSAGGQLLRPSTVYSMPKHAETRLLFGATSENRAQTFDKAQAAQFPIVEMRRRGAQGASVTEATPRPRAIKP